MSDQAAHEEMDRLFREHRDYLFAIAYRMLGSVMDAEDLVQETFIRWQKAQPQDLRSDRAWLTTVITRLCINHLKSAQVMRKEYIGPWLPEPLVDDGADPNLSDSLSMAFLVVLENLSATERAVFLLREVFDYEFSEIARTVKKSPDNCRQILVRAKRQVAARQPRFENSPGQHEPLLDRFVQATAKGDVPGLMALLDEHAMLVTDGGGKARALLRPIAGSDGIARVLIGGIQKFAPAHRTYVRETVNGLPGLIGYDEGRPTTVIVFGILRDKIHSIQVVRNPDKLRSLAGRRR
ncbi:RNA polymerase sigma-70 factor [Opitutaceae bacterium EW11]|nr:RNA polymerase sigma-70 factor [Opitutaceae bacterium EW11]